MLALLFYCYLLALCTSEGDISASANYYLWIFIMPHSLRWSHIVLLTVGVFSSNHGVLYAIGISITRRFQKM